MVFDPQTGEFLDNPGGQGFKQGSSWSRGQSWAVYGFSLTYRHTKDESFLNTAKRCAHYSISNLAVNDWLPLVDADYYFIEAVLRLKGQELFIW